MSSHLHSAEAVGYDEGGAAAAERLEVPHHRHLRP
jgi:hypothetical protein